MGSGASQSRSQDSSCGVCQRFGSKSKRLPLHAPPWSIVATFESSRWTLLAEYHGFPNPAFCPGKSKRMYGEFVWNSGHVLEGSHDREQKALVYKRHGDSASVIHPYKSNYYLVDYIADRELTHILPANGNFVTFVFSPSLQQATGDLTYLIYILSEQENVKAYFFLENLYPHDIEIHQVELSPNQGRVCVLLSEKGKIVTFNMHVYSKRPAAYDLSFQGNMFELEYEVPGITACRVVPKLMFDPRYHTRRMGIINVRSIQFLEVHNYFTVYDLSKKAMLVSDQICDEAIKLTQLAEATYSPDGTYVVALVLCVPPEDEISSKVSRAVLVFDSDSLCLLRTIHIGIQNMRDCFIRFTPTFSRCGRKIAIKRNQTIMVVQLPCPKTLQILCKSLILLKKQFYDNAGSLPKTIVDFLQNKSYLH